MVSVALSTTTAPVPLRRRPVHSEPVRYVSVCVHVCACLCVREI